MIDPQALTAELISAFHLEGVPKEKQEELIAKFGEALLKRIFLETMEKLGDAGVKEYETLLDKGANEQEVSAFLEVKIPGYEIFIEDTAKHFKSEMIENL